MRGFSKIKNFVQSATELRGVLYLYSLGEREAACCFITMYFEQKDDSVLTVVLVIFLRKLTVPQAFNIQSWSFCSSIGK